MTRPTEAGKHSGDAQCVGGRSWADLYPKWPAKYVAFALAHGATDLDAFRASQTSRKPFDSWVSAQESQFRAAHGLDQKRPLGPRTQTQFDRWLERRSAPEHIGTIVDRVMADALSRQGGAR
jgi:hypothetical protein